MSSDNSGKKHDNKHGDKPLEIPAKAGGSVSEVPSKVGGQGSPHKGHRSERPHENQSKKGEGQSTPKDDKTFNGQRYDKLQPEVNRRLKGIHNAESPLILFPITGDRCEDVVAVALLRKNEEEAVAALTGASKALYEEIYQEIQRVKSSRNYKLTFVTRGQTLSLAIEW